MLTRSGMTANLEGGRRKPKVPTIKRKGKKAVHVSYGPEGMRMAAEAEAGGAKVTRKKTFKKKRKM